MYIIIKRTETCDTILNVFYGQDNANIIIHNWMKDYIKNDIISLQMKPLEKGIKNVSYILDDTTKDIKLIQNFKQVHPGYIYNSSEKINKTLYTLVTMEYNKQPQSIQSENIHLEQSLLFTNINDEINKRILKKLDKESLYQVFITLQNKINTKTTINSNEYSNLISDTIQSFKKLTYSSIARKMIRFGKYKNKLNNEVKQESNNVPIDFNSNKLNCKLQFKKYKEE